MQTDLLSRLTLLPPRTQRLVVLTGWAVIAIGLMGIVVRMETLITVRSDFTQDYLAAQAFRQGESIYEPFAPADLAALGLKAEGLENFHPPSTILLLLPFSYLPYPVAISVWTGLSVVLYLLIWRIVLREIGLTIPDCWRPLLVGLSLLWYPFQFHIIVAQLSLPLAACVVGCWVALRRGIDLLAGALLGLAILIKLFPALLLLYLLIRRRWRELASTLAVGAFGGLLTIVVIGFDDLARYQADVAPRNLAIFRTALHNVSLNAVFSRLFIGDRWIAPLWYAPWLADTLAFTANLVVVLLLATLIWRLPRTQAGDTIAFAFVCVAIPLLTPVSWSHSFPLLILPFALLVRELLAHPTRRDAQLVLLACVLISLPDIPLARLIADLYVPALVPWFATLPMLFLPAGLLLLLWLLYRHCVPKLDVRAAP